MIGKEEIIKTGPSNGMEWMEEEEEAHRDVLLVLFQSHQTCTGTVPKTRLARAHRANRQRQGSNLQNEDFHTQHRRDILVCSTYGESSTAPEPITRIRQLIRAACESATIYRCQSL